MRLIALALLLASCAPGSEQDGPRLNLTRGGNFLCSGVRVAPTTLLTAKHCGESLSLNGTAIRKVAELTGRDIAVFSCPAGPYHRTVFYNEEPGLTVYLQDGEWAVMPLAHSDTTIAFARRCQPGDSGSPLMSASGVVGIVNATTTSFCYADFTEGIP